MTPRRNIITLCIILALGVIAGVFVYQPLWSSLSDFRPWRLGFDVAGGANLEYAVDLSGVAEADAESVLQGLQDLMERRVNLFGVSEPRVYVKRVGDESRLAIELAGVHDVNAAIKEIGETPLLDFREVALGSSADGGEPIYTQTLLNGRHVKGASVSFDEFSGAPVVNFELTGEGGELFQELTKRNVGKPIAVFLDNELIEAPVVREEITGGRAQISGSFTLDEARTLVARFNAGALPAPITLVAENTVSAVLGGEALRRILIAGAAGLGLVVLYMVAYYRALGIWASAALLLYVVFTLGIFKLVPVTLSLSTIAGFVLSIGMAVDANVLVFERVKEELKKGMPRRDAIEAGFKRSWNSIRDANLTTMFAAVILFYVATNFVRGFALALLIGVAMSMVSAVLITRTLLRTTS